jgi:integrase/recombinase XerD
MTSPRTAMEDYLNVRRHLGFVLERDGYLLPAFVSYLEESGSSIITTELALAWAITPQDAHPAWWRQRLGVVRGFARYLQTLDASNEVPPVGLLRGRRPRLRPYLYSDDDLGGLLDAARALAPPCRAITYETLIGLLAVTGLRPGEALRLDRTDVAIERELLMVRRAKGDQVREVPLHWTTIEALARYSRIRDERWRGRRTSSFFVSMVGARLGRSTVDGVFRTLVRHAGLQGRGERCRPRLHDLRHTFAVRTLLGWYRTGVDVDSRLPLLSTYLGHVDPASTYWYLEAAPELLSLVGDRLQQVLGDLP